MPRLAKLVPILLAMAGAAACAPSTAPAPTSAPGPAARPSDPDGEAFDAAEAVYRRGFVEEAMGRWRAMRSPAAAARVAVLENHPEAALAIPAKDDLRLLKAQARAGLMLGDVGAVEGVLTRAKAIPGAEPFATELGAFMAVAKLGRSSRIMRVVSEATATVPFDATHRVPIVEVRFGNRTERFIVDSGADMTIVDTRAAERIGVRLPAGAGTQATSVAGTIRASRGMVDRMEVLGLALEDVTVGVADFSALAEWSIAGALGLQQLFLRDVVTIDYASKHVTRSRQSRPEGIPMILVGAKYISVRGALKGGPQGLFQIETGVDRALISSTYLKAAVAFHAPFDVTRPFEWTNYGMGGGRTGPARLVNGSAFCAKGEPSCFDIREVLEWDPLAEVAQSLTNVEHDGVLGAAAFEGRVLELDYPALRVRVRPGDGG